jgi:molybdate transport system permease protein
VIAALPPVVLGSRNRLQELDRGYGNAARSLGCSEWRIFWRVMLPLGWRPILAAAAIAFVRVWVEWTIVAAL